VTKPLAARALLARKHVRGNEKPGLFGGISSTRESTLRSARAQKSTARARNSNRFASRRTTSVAGAPKIFIFRSFCRILKSGWGRSRHRSEWLAQPPTWVKIFGPTGLFRLAIKKPDLRVYRRRSADDELPATTPFPRSVERSHQTGRDQRRWAAGNVDADRPNVPLTLPRARGPSGPWPVLPAYPHRFCAAISCSFRERAGQSLLVRGVRDGFVLQSPATRGGSGPRHKPSNRSSFECDLIQTRSVSSKRTSGSNRRGLGIGDEVPGRVPFDKPENQRGSRVAARPPRHPSPLASLLGAIGLVCDANSFNAGGAALLKTTPAPGPLSRQPTNVFRVVNGPPFGGGS